MSLLSVLLTGCALNDTSTTPSPIPGPAISGAAYGGKAPIAGAKVYLLAANPAGYGSGSLSLLTTAHTLNAVDSIGSYTTTAPVTGGFNLAPGSVADYSCTTGYAQGASTASGGITLPGNEQVYLYILGGNPGAGTNSNSGLIAALGPCNAPYATTSLVVNELTTLAAAYAFSGYATDVLHVSSSGRGPALTGLANAGLNAANLGNIQGGIAVASTASITRPVTTLYTLANILSSCVNGTTGNTNCSSLFQYTKSGGATGTAATETATAAINLAHNPWPTATGMTTLYGLVPSTGAPYAPGLTSQPNDFTVGLNYNSGGLYSPYSVAIDAAGDAWTSNFYGNSLSEFSSTGSGLSTTAGYTGGGLDQPQDLAIDTSGNVWVANSTNSSISEFSSVGAPVSPAAGYTGGGLAFSYGIAIDSSSNVWVSNNRTSSISKLSSSGTAVSSSSGDTGGGLNGPYSVAIDASGNVWVANIGNDVTELSSSGTPITTNYGYTGGGLSYPYGIAIDAAGNVWVANYYNAVSEFSSTGAAISPTGGYTGGGLSGSYTVAIDGIGNVWASNRNGSVTELSSTGAAISPSTGYTSGGLNYTTSLAIDASGDVWATNFNNSTVTEIIGAAAPVVTPLAASLIAPYGPASRP